MKGIVFNLFNELVEEKFGLEVWEKVLEEAKVPSDGIYVSVELYDDQEMLSLVGALAKVTNLPANDLIQAFGEFMLYKFVELYPDFFKDKDLKSFLASIDKVIHVEVQKLHDGAITPLVLFEEVDDTKGVVIYQSPRKMCPLAEGLMRGAANYYKTPMKMAHTACMHDGANQCRIELDFAA